MIDVLGHNVVGKVRRQLLPAGAVAQRNGYGALSGLLPDNMLVQFGDDLARSQFLERKILVFGGSWEINGHRVKRAVGSGALSLRLLL